MKKHPLSLVLILIMGLTLAWPRAGLAQVVKNEFLSVYDYGPLDGAVDENNFRLKLGQWVEEYNKLKQQVLSLSQDQAEKTVLHGDYKDKLQHSSALAELDDAVRPVLDRWTEIWDVQALSMGDRKVMTLLKEYGINCKAVEGWGLLMIDWNYLCTLLLPNPSPETLDYMIAKGDQPDYFFGEGGCFYSLEEMGAWAINWEQFLVKYPQGKHWDLAKKEYHLFMEHILFRRLNTSPASRSWTWDNEPMPDYWVEGLETVMAKYPETQTAKIVQDFLTTIQKNNYIPSSLIQEKFMHSIMAVYDPASNFQSSAAAQSPALIAMEEKLLGEHMFSLQWISWEKLGTAMITHQDSGLYIEAQQELDGQYVTLSGQIEVLDERNFTITGTLVTCITHMNNGQPCVRNEMFTFSNEGKRKFWRLQEMENPCDLGVDYVDIYF